jgi:hypothetical protein
MLKKGPKELASTAAAAKSSPTVNGTWSIATHAVTLARTVRLNLCLLLLKGEIVTLVFGQTGVQVSFTYFLKNVVYKVLNNVCKSV